MTYAQAQKINMRSKRELAEAEILNGPDCPARAFLLLRIERRTGVKPKPALPQIEKPAVPAAPPRNIGEIRELPAEPSGVPVTVRNGKSVGRPFDLTNDPDTYCDGKAET